MAPAAKAAPLLTIDSIQTHVVQHSKGEATTHTTLELSVLDVLMGPYPYFLVPLLFEGPMPPLEVMIASLQQTLTLYQPFCGRLITIKNGDFDILCNNAGILLHTGSSPSVKADLLPADATKPYVRCDCAPAVPGVPRTGMAAADKDEALLRLSMVSLADGATLITGCVSHMVADFRTFASFMEHWAAASRSMCHAAAPAPTMRAMTSAAAPLMPGRCSTHADEMLSSQPAEASPVTSPAAPKLPGGPPTWGREQSEGIASKEAPAKVPAFAPKTLTRVVALVGSLIWAKVTTGEMVPVSRLVPEARVKQLKELATADIAQMDISGEKPWVSTHDALAARCWQMVGQLSSRGPKPFGMWLAVELRQRTTPALSPHACGNLGSINLGPARHAAHERLGCLALDLRATINGAIQRAAGALAYLAAVRKERGLLATVLPGPFLGPQPVQSAWNGHIILSQWKPDYSKLAFSDGLGGCPVWMVVQGAGPNVIYTAPVPPGTAGGGWLVTMHLPMKQAEEWMAADL